MKQLCLKFAIVFVVVLITLLQACQKDDQTINQVSQKSSIGEMPKSIEANTFYSSTLPIGGGVVRAWVKENKNGEPIGVGVTLSEKALQNLPDEPSQFVLELPKNKGKNFYTHVLLDWNPHGHEPEHIYDQPHFDFHFYTIPNKDRMAIGPNDSMQFANAPATQYIPPVYMQIPGGVPQMGAHWADLLSPEFHGSLFTKTFIWGSYDGKFIFWEPMITRDFLLSHPNEMVPIRQPEAYQKDGYYATSYKISYSERPKEYTISLVDLVFRNGQ
jgi:hypothetical protein